MPRCSLWAGGCSGVRFGIIPAGFNGPLGFESQRLEFLTGFNGIRFNIPYFKMVCKGKILEEEIVHRENSTQIFGLTEFKY
jgi:hypothetical protein